MFLSDLSHSKRKQFQQHIHPGGTVFKFRYRSSTRRRNHSQVSLHIRFINIMCLLLFCFSTSRIRRTVASSIRRLRKSRSKRADIENTLGTAGRKYSAINSSGASIVYPGRMSTKDRRLLKMILVILTAFITCYLPITASKFIRPIQEISYLNIMGYLLIYLTTCINPIIYVVMSSEYRQAYWNLLMCRLATSRRPPNGPKDVLVAMESIRPNNT